MSFDRTEPKPLTVLDVVFIVGLVSAFLIYLVALPYFSPILRRSE